MENDMSPTTEKKSRPQDRWDAKAGVAAKTYKVNKEVAEKFKEACKKAGVGMGPQITKMMERFIEEVNKGQ